MPEAIVMVSFAGALFAAALVPGPAAAFCVAAGFDGDYGISLAAPLGVTMGKLVHLMIAAAGALWIVRMPQAVRFGLLAVAATYMVAQGLRRWRAADRLGTPAHPNPQPRHHVIWHAFLLSVANPQSLASSVAILPLFAPVAKSGLGWAILLGAGAIGVGAAYVLYEVLAGIVAGRIGDRALRRVTGATYLLAGGAMAALAAV